MNGVGLGYNRDSSWSAKTRRRGIRSPRVGCRQAPGAHGDPPRQLCCLLDGMAQGYVVAEEDVGTEVLTLSDERM